MDLLRENSNDKEKDYTKHHAHFEEASKAQLNISGNLRIVGGQKEGGMEEN